jgi:hypothetical protein
MPMHVDTLAIVRIHHIRRLKQVRRQLEPDISALLDAALILSRLHNCNAVLVALPKSTIAPMK